MDGSRIDFSGRGEPGDFIVDGRPLFACGVELGARGLISVCEHQGVAFADELLFVLQSACYRGDAVGEIGLSPARCGFDAVQRGDRAAFSQVLTLLVIKDLHLGECEDVVVFARGEFDSRDADITAFHAVIAGGVGFKGRQARILEIIHERRVMLAPDECDAGFEFRIVTGFEFETHREAEAAADLAEVIVAWLEHDPLDLNRAAEIDLHPFYRVLFV